MTTLLTDLLAAGLIDNVNGSDERIEKIERAAEAMAQEFRDNPPLLIRGVLAGLDPGIPPDDPLMVLTEKKLVAEWKSMRTVHTDSPVGLLRVILLEACNQVAEEKQNAAIVWMTAADTFKFLRLGKYEKPIQLALKTWADILETLSLTSSEKTNTEPKPVFTMPEIKGVAPVKSNKVDREALLKRIAAATGPNYRNQQQLPNCNPNWSNNGGNWSWDFTDRMRDILADQFDGLSSTIATTNSEITKQFLAAHTESIKAVSGMLSSQQDWVLKSLKTKNLAIQTEQTRLNSLWWSEALYSPSLRCGYREIPPELAATVMAFDLLAEVSKPTPASVVHLLAETVNRLPGAGFDRKQGFRDWLLEICKTRDQFPQIILKDLIPPPDEGRLSLRDAVVLALGKNPDIDAALRRTGIGDDAELSLPVFSRALFRQEQAVQLAGGGA